MPSKPFATCSVSPGLRPEISAGAFKYQQATARMRYTACRSHRKLRRTSKSGCAASDQSFGRCSQNAGIALVAINAKRDATYSKCRVMVPVYNREGV